MWHTQVDLHRRLQGLVRRHSAVRGPADQEHVACKRVIVLKLIHQTQTQVSAASKDDATGAVLCLAKIGSDSRATVICRAGLYARTCVQHFIE